MRRMCFLGLACLLAASAEAWGMPVTFRIQPEGTPSRVNLAGTFNNWRDDATPMEKTAEGAWTVTLDLAPGSYQYKYVLDGSRWLSDPKVTSIPPNDNNVLWVVPEGQSAERKLGDGKVLAFALAHDPAEAVRIGKDRVQIKLRTAAGDVQGAGIWLVETDQRPPVPMRRIGTDGLTDTWAVTIPAKKALRYLFTLRDGDETQVYATNGTWPIESSAHAEPVPFTLDTNKMPVFETPDWVRDTVWYQVFPERFANGNKANDPAPPKGVKGWDTPLSAVSGNPNDHWWGGDLQGVIDKIPYLKSLGITGIYLNPIFAGPDTHLYATTDYLKVAPELGDEATLKRLVDTAHRNGMRVMLDGVFNHTSVWFFAFRDILKNQEASPYKGWYNIRSFPVLDPVTHYLGADERNIPYEGWWGIKWMPKLNTTDPGAEKYLLNVATYWIKQTGIDGWRLDVANEVSPEYWRKFRKAVKGAKPGAYIIGEIWDNAAPWLRGDQFDAVMNYRFRGAALDFFAHGTMDAATFARQLETVRNDYPPQATAVMFNLLGSHDTARLLTEAGGDARKVALATVFQMTYPGSPSIYYGDEIGMSGGNDPNNRAPMVWNKAKWNAGLRETVRRAVALRHAHPALRGVTVETLFAPEGGRTVALLRRGGGETAVTVFNASDTEQTITIPAGRLPDAPAFRDAWTGGTVRPENGTLTLKMAPLAAAILFPERAKAPARGK